MKKRFQIILFVCSLLIGFLMCLSSCEKSKEIRIRIRPNDNSNESLLLKEEVKQTTLSLLKKTNNKNINDLVKYLDNSLKKEYNDIKVEYKIESFPIKAINQEVIPSGDYPTILITIGNGKGDNWWSILYPEYFGLDYSSTNEVEYKSYFYELWNK